MEYKLHHYFVATRANAYQPHFLRWWSLGLIGFGLLAMQLFFNVSAAQPSLLGYATDVDASSVLEQTNQQRQELGLPALETNPKLDAAARAKAQDMFDNNYWAHVAPDGTEPWDFFEQQGYSYLYAGENLAKNFATSGGVVQGWMNSPGHRANLLSEQYQELGLAVVNGKLQGEETTLVVALYATPVSAGPTIVADQQPASTGPVSSVGTSDDTAGQVLDVDAAALTWAQRASLPVLGFIGLLYVGQHIVVQRKHLQWDHLTHPRPLLQAGVIFGVMFAVILSGQGVIL